jgi:hypothetical protein
MSLHSVALLGLTALFAGNVQAALFTYSTGLSGAAEDPPNMSSATGTAIILYDDVAQTLGLTVSFSGLTGTTAVAHVHCCTALPKAGNAGVAVSLPTLPGFPVGVSSGTYSTTIDLTDAAVFGSSFLSANGGTPTTAEAALAAGLASERAYFNIHTSIYSGGEIRGFASNAVPEPAMLSLLSLGLLAGLSLRRRA